MCIKITSASRRSRNSYNDVVTTDLSKIPKYSVFTDKVEHNCHFPASSRNCWKKVSLFYCFYGAILDSCRKNLVVLGGESCSSSREAGSDTYIQLYQ
jgi:hypothetical protein